MQSFSEVGIALDELLTKIDYLIQVIDLNGAVLYANPHWLRVLKCSESQVQTLNFIQDILHEKHRETFGGLFSQATVKQVEDVQLVLVTQDGANVDVRGNITPRIVDSKIIALVCVFHDVTEQRLPIQRVNEAKEQLQAILDNSGLVVGLKDLDGHYILVNNEFSRQLGNSQQESVLGKTDYDLFPLDIAQQLRANDTDVLRLHRTMQFEEFLPDGNQLRTYLTTKFTLDDNNGNPYAVCMIAKDITQRKMTEIQLLIRNKAIEHSPTGIAIADAQLSDNPLIYVNPAFERITGYSAVEVIGHNCRFLQGADRDQPQISQIRRAIQQQQSATVVLRNYRKDGTRFYNELSLAPIHDDEGRLTHYVGISTDVTNRIEAAQQIQSQNEALLAANRDLALARREAEGAARLKSQFLATMSHELRTPLNAIIGYTEIQLAGMSGELTPEQRDYQERVLANADNLLELINDVLDIAKIEAGRLEIVRKVFNLSQLVADIEAQMRMLAEDKGLKFTVNLDERMPVYLMGDPARIKQIAINLLSNAIKFTNEGWVRLQLRKQGRNAWKLIVEDSGIGIPPHLQETIFEEFRQVDSSSHRKARGTGLGLSIVRKLVLMMGGNVRLKSQLGAGSTFTIILPIVEVSEATVEEGEFSHD